MKVDKIAEEIISHINQKVKKISKRDYIEFCTILIDNLSACREATEEEMETGEEEHE